MPPKRKAPTAKSKVTTASTSRSNTNSTAGPSGTSSPPLRKRARKRPLGDDGLITSSTDWADVVAASLLDTSSASVRRAPFKTRPTLLSAAIRVFAANFKTLGNKGGDLQLTRLIDRLKIVPPHLMDKLWRRLLIHCPEVFSIHIISEIIGSLSDIYLPGDVINAVSNMQSFSQLHLNKERITKFELTGNSKLTDDQVAKYVAGLPMVEEVILRWVRSRSFTTDHRSSSTANRNGVDHLRFQSSLGPDLFLSPFLFGCSHASRQRYHSG